MILINNDCIAAMKEMDDNSVDSIVTDPPYELGFMGKSWDASGIAFNVDVWREALRVLKPGGHLIAFSGSRTYHRMAVAIEDAGFEIRDQIMWVYGSGFPKSLNIAKQLDKLAGVKGEVIGQKTGKGYSSQQEKNLEHGFCEYKEGLPYEHADLNEYALASDEAKQWQGWGTALKPAHEPIVLARKPIVGTVANNVLTYNVGGLNIDGTRVETNDKWEATGKQSAPSQTLQGGVDGSLNVSVSTTHPLGRFPANFIHDGLETEWAKFFYCAKTSKRDRNEGLEGFEEKQTTGGGGLTASVREDGSLETASAGGKYGSVKAKQTNHHPTVKPTALMQYLVRLVTPSGGVVLDPFMGSGSTGKACVYEGFNFIGIEQSVEYVEIAQARIDFAIKSIKEGGTEEGML